jgi:hypothetical protein
MYPRHYFDLFRPDVDEETVFVGMSFAPDDERRWRDLIEPATNDAGFRPLRVDMSTVVSDAILIDVMKGILNSKILLFDISADSNGNRNGNVMYELGLAHAIRTPEAVVIIRSDSTPLLFDVSNMRIHVYDLAAVEQSRAFLSEILKQVAANQISVRTMMLDRVVSMLDEVCLGFMESHGHMDAFSHRSPERAFEPDAVAGRSAIRHMLELGVVVLEWRKEHHAYAFRWTYMGRAVLQYLGFDQPRKGADQTFGYADRS